MANSPPPWLKFTGIGCLILVGLTLLAGVGSFVFVRISGDRSISTQVKLDEHFPSAAEFTPPPTTVLTPEQIESFMNVRRSLAVFCPEFTNYTDNFRRIERLEKQDEEPALGKALTDMGLAVKATFGTAGSLNRYLIIRNQALLEEGMGLGEFSWLFVLIFHSWLGHEHEPFILARHDEPDVFDDRVVPEIRAMFARHVAALEQAAAADRKQTDTGFAWDLDPWWDENTALAADPDRIPFADGLPESMTSVLEPYRRALEQLFCPATEDLDLARAEREGIGYEHR